MPTLHLTAEERRGAESPGAHFLPPFRCGHYAGCIPTTVLSPFFVIRWLAVAHRLQKTSCFVRYEITDKKCKHRFDMLCNGAPTKMAGTSSSGENNSGLDLLASLKQAMSKASREKNNKKRRQLHVQRQQQSQDVCVREACNTGYTRRGGRATREDREDLPDATRDSSQDDSNPDEQVGTTNQSGRACEARTATDAALEQGMIRYLNAETAAKSPAPTLEQERERWEHEVRILRLKHGLKMERMRLKARLELERLRLKYRHPRAASESDS